MKGIILYGINNIYTVEAEGQRLLCRIKGKVFRNSEKYYNPLAPGDIVNIEQDSHSENEGTILSLEKRKNIITRWNRKRFLSQIIASNIDTLVSITSPVNPPFRPRFTDRVFLNCSYDVEKILVVNKNDQKISRSMDDRLSVYMETGINVIKCSAETGEGISELALLLKGKYSAVIGQSGVGKSTLINLLRPDARQKTAEISIKHNRGRHTTNFSILLQDRINGGGLIDTPGIREIFLDRITPLELSHRFPEFRPYSEKCGFSGCTHVNEPDCAVLNALENRLIHKDRYQSYLNLFYELTDMSEEVYGKSYT